jgi:predicted nucleic acid-binding protein
MSLLLDTSILIGGQVDPAEEVAISAVSIAELHFGVLVAGDEEARATWLRRLAVVEGPSNRFPSTPPWPASAAGSTRRSCTEAASRDAGPSTW